MESQFSSLQLYADEFVESAGAVVFKSQQICLIHHRIKNEYLLPKGRRNCGESRIQAAIREVLEETGWHCLPIPVLMSTRGPPSQELGYTPDVAEVRETRGHDPFALTIREEGGNKRKLIWWYVVKVDENMQQERTSEVDSDLEPVIVSYEGAVNMLTYKGDRELVERAMELVRNSLPS